MSTYENEIRLSGGLASMGKTVESFRLALEGEINRWSGFARALCKLDREAFDELMDISRTYASESSCATNPIVFEQLEAIKPEKINTSESYEASAPFESKPESNIQVVPNGGEQRR